MNIDVRGFLRIAAVLLPRLIAAGCLVFALATTWAWTITGILEPATLDVDYLEMGAGNDLLFVRATLALAVAFLTTGWAFLNGTCATRLLKLGLALTILAVFELSVTSLDRAAPGFSDARFQEVIGDHLEGRKLTIDDIRKRLGKPLMMYRDDRNVAYAYTFTPSGGFGWHKRFLTFDAEGRLVDFNNMDEP